MEIFLIQEEELEVLFQKRKIIKIALGIVIVFIYKPIKLKNVEEEIIADADVLAHFDNLSMLFYIPFGKMKLPFAESKDFVKRKLEFDYKKLSPYGKEKFKERYDHIMETLFGHC